MKNVKFSESGKPIIIGVVKEPTADAAISTIKNCEKEGATAFDLHVSLLEGKEREPESLARIFTECDSPILAVHYNNLPKGITQKNTSEERMAELVRAVEVGAAGIDMQGYTFCKEPRATLVGKDEKKYPFVTANPKEVVLDDAVITRQRQIIDRVHALGGEVLMSTHTGVYLNTEQIVSLALEIEKREVDIIKLVTPVNTKEEVVEALGSIIELQKNIKNAKIHFHCSGRLGRITRYIAPYFDSAIVFATDYYNDRADKEQLLIGKFLDFYEQIKTED